MKLLKMFTVSAIASAMLIAPTAGANPGHGEAVPAWDPGNSSHDINNAHIVDPQPVYNNGDVITVHVDNLKPNKKYVAGQCQMLANTTFWFFKLPGCIGDNQVSVETNSNGELTFEIAVLNYGANVHAGVPIHGGGDDYIEFYPDNEGGQPLKSDAEIVIVEDHGKGFRGTQVADTAETFRVHRN